MMWERIDSLIPSHDGKTALWPDTYSQRMAVPGGWLVRTVSRIVGYSAAGASVHTVFIADPEGEWEVTLNDFVPEPESSRKQA